MAPITGMVITMTDASLPRLLQLCSQALPVGAYAYSQGLESAIAEDIVKDSRSAGHWIAGVLSEGLASLDVPALFLACKAARDQDVAQIMEIDHYLQASRETRELLLEDVEMGRALHRLLGTLGVQCPDSRTPSFVTRFALAGAAWDIADGQLASGFCFSWVENQIAVAIKSIPLGQSDGQLLLGELMPVIASAVIGARAIADAAQDGNWQFGISLPGVAVLSARHEVLDGRLYRS